MGDVEITLERNGRQGRYLLPLPGGEPARLTFVETGPDHIAIDYSFVPPAYRGRGVALKLIVKAVEDARAKGYKITPALRLCRSRVPASSAMGGRAGTAMMR